jgi:hypothetical protein
MDGPLDPAEHVEMVTDIIVGGLTTIGRVPSDAQQ